MIARNWKKNAVHPLSYATFMKSQALCRYLIWLWVIFDKLGPMDMMPLYKQNYGFVSEWSQM